MELAENQAMILLSAITRCVRCSLPCGLILAFAFLLTGCGGEKTTKQIGPSNSKLRSSINPDQPVDIVDLNVEMAQHDDIVDDFTSILEAHLRAMETALVDVAKGKNSALDFVGNSTTVSGMNRIAFKATFSDDRIRVARWRASAAAPKLTGEDSFRRSMAEAYKPWIGASKVRVDLKATNVVYGNDELTADIIAQYFGIPDQKSGREATALWRTKWNADSKKNTLTLTQLDILGQEEIVNYTPGGTLYADSTASILRRCESLSKQLTYGMDHWARRIPGLDPAGHHGVSVSDINKDGLDDIYVCQPHGLPNLLLIQNPDGTAEDMAAELGVNLLDESRGALMIDLDNDRDQDLVISTDEALILLSQRQDGKFQLEHRIAAGRDAHSLSAADYDMDGDLDLFICKYNSVRTIDDVFAYPRSYSDAISGGRNVLLRNDEGWVFTDVTETVGLTEPNRNHTRSAVWFDYDVDGDLDLFVTNEFNQNLLFNNQDAWFMEVGERFSMNSTGRHRSSTVGEFNGDGKLDLFVSTDVSFLATNAIKSALRSESTKTSSALLSPTHTWYSQPGETPFRNYTLRGPIFMPGSSYSTGSADINNDGLDDVVVTNGKFTRELESDVGGLWYEKGLFNANQVAGGTSEGEIQNLELNRAAASASELIRKGYSFESRQRNRCYLGLGKLGFANFSALSGVDSLSDGRAVAMTDWDWDGDVDIVTTSRNGPQVQIFSNQLKSKNKSVQFDLAGIQSNRDAIGARVEVFLKSRARPLVRAVTAGSGMLSQSSKRLSFGLGANPIISKIVVHWPNSKAQTFTEIKPGSVYKITEGKNDVAEINNDRFQKINFDSTSTLEPVQAPVSDRAVFYPPRAIPNLQFQGAKDKWNEIEPISDMPLVVYFWKRDTLSEELLQQFAKQASTFDEKKIDVLAVMIDVDSKSYDNDFTNAGDSIRTSGFPFRWGTASLGLVQKLKIWLGDSFAHQQQPQLPMAMLIDSDRRVRVLYPTEKLNVDLILRDIELVHANSEALAKAAAALPGRWASINRSPSYKRLISRLETIGYMNEAREFQSEMSPHSALEMVNHAIELAARKDFTKAKDFFDRAIEIDPKSIQAYVHDGELMLSAAMYDPNVESKTVNLIDAKKSFLVALELDPKNTEAIVGLAKVFMAQDKNEEALTRLKQYLEIDPKRYEVHAIVGGLYFRQQNYVESAKYLMTAFENRPTLPEVAGNLGSIYSLGGNYKEAVKFLRLGHRLQPSQIKITRELAEAEFRVSNFDPAIKHANEAVKKRPTDFHSKTILAWLLATCPYPNSRNADEAIRIMEPLVEIKGETSPTTLEVFAACFAEKGDFDRALQLQQQAKKILESDENVERYSSAQKAGLESRLQMYQRKKPYRTANLAEVPIQPPGTR